MRQQDVIWLAGLLEGEGCFSVRPDKNRQPRVTIEMTDEDIIERVARLWDSNISARKARVRGICNTCGTTNCAVVRDYRKGRMTADQLREYGYSVSQPTWQTAIYGERARNLMRLVYPFMGQRRAARIEEILGALV